MTKTEIAEEIGVHKSSVGRELKRNANKKGGYNPNTAEVFAKERKERFGLKRKFTKSIQKNVYDYLTKEQWSPEQIVVCCLKFDIHMVSI